jgi:formylglycine-generating enzyme
MVPTRWSLMVAILALGGLAAVDVPHAPIKAGAKTGGESQREPTVPQAQQAAKTAVPSSAAEQTASSGTCPADMVEVQGDYCPAPEQICEEYISEKRDRCERFRQKVRCYGKPEAKHFCMDRYEFPNEAGHRPTVSVTWDQARDVCANEGKRLCGAEEWTLACEGPERKPYPFGFARDATACNFDKPYILPDNMAYNDPQTRRAEIDRVNQSEPSGSRPGCVSDYGILDLTGNVDEWVVNEHGSPQGPEFQSGLKGGYWGPVRNRCRPMTTDHNSQHHGYQIGFRCCKDTDDTGQPPPIGGNSVAEPQPTVQDQSRSDTIGPARS